MGASHSPALVEGKVHLSPAFVQPIASDDVADAMADVALEPPVNGLIEIAGPERFRLNELVARYLEATGDARPVVADQQAKYFGARTEDLTLVSDNNPRLGKIGFEQWFAAGLRK